MRRGALLVAVALALAGCDYKDCADESVEFALPAPGDGVEIEIRACTDRRRGDVEFILDLAVGGEPASPLLLAVDGVDLWPGAGLSWSSATGFSDEATDADCDPGKRITVRRLDADPTITITGQMRVVMSAPPRVSCTAPITVSPL